jgi:CubicO group peptidase (beta-lactamase class C family)
MPISAAKSATRSAVGTAAVRRRIKLCVIYLLLPVVAVLVLLPLGSSMLAWKPLKALQVASAYTSHMICSGVFISRGLPEEIYAETVETSPGFGLINWAMHYEVDLARRQVTTTIAGGFAGRAVFRDGVGCLVVHGAAPPAAAGSQALSVAMPSGPPLLPEIAGDGVVEAANPAFRASLDRAFNEPTRAIVIVHDGHVIAERYAPGIGVDTPLLGNSLTKSVTSALIGILVRQGRLAVDRSAPVAAWRDPADPRHGITIDHLLRQTSGLDIVKDDSGFDPVSRMLMLEDDMAGYAEAVSLSAAPGARWRYTSGNYIILSHIIRDASGGNSEAVLRFARREMFDPLGMRTVTLEFDSTGTPIGSTFMFASARDWARLGMLYPDDGVVAGHRILPEGWVRYSTSPAPGSRRGYGAGWWAPVEQAENRREEHEKSALPADVFLPAAASASLFWWFLPSAWSWSALVSHRSAMLATSWMTPASSNSLWTRSLPSTLVRARPRISD